MTGETLLQVCVLVLVLHLERQETPTVFLPLPRPPQRHHLYFFFLTLPPSMWSPSCSPPLSSLPPLPSASCPLLDSFLLVCNLVLFPVLRHLCWNYSFILGLPQPALHGSSAEQAKSSQSEKTKGPCCLHAYVADAWKILDFPCNIRILDVQVFILFSLDLRVSDYVK